MICLAVLESNRLKKELIRQWVRRYASKQKCGLEILWLLDQDPLDKVEKYAMGMQIALINLDSDKGEACESGLQDSVLPIRAMLSGSSAVHPTDQFLSLDTG